MADNTYDWRTLSALKEDFEQFKDLFICFVKGHVYETYETYLCVRCFWAISYTVEYINQDEYYKNRPSNRTWRG